MNTKQQQATVTLVLKHNMIFTLYKDTIKRTKESMTVHVHSVSFNLYCIQYDSLLSFVLSSYSVINVLYICSGHISLTATGLFPGLTGAGYAKRGEGEDGNAHPNKPGIVCFSASKTCFLLPQTSSKYIFLKVGRLSETHF